MSVLPSKKIALKVKMAEIGATGKGCAGWDASCMFCPIRAFYPSPALSEICLFGGEVAREKRLWGTFNQAIYKEMAKELEDLEFQELEREVLLG